MTTPDMGRDEVREHVTSAVLETPCALRPPGTLATLSIDLCPACPG
ncbi:MAG: hypothetical protein FWE61_09795 [Micrococcales bacterium]|nr:hypothetical protein [Micrococcales bacterium]